jgi:hypothetical protein
MTRSVPAARVARQPLIWQGRFVIAEGEIFLTNWQSADSLDGTPRSAADNRNRRTGGAYLDS